MKLSNLRVPKTALLNKIGDIDDQGNYSSPIQSKGKRFGMLIAALTGGWVNVPWIATEQSFVTLSIALRYSLTRKQFGNPEVQIIDYPLQQYRLFKLYAENITYWISALKVNEIWQENLPNLLDEKNWRSELCHGLSSAAKAFNSWASHNTIQECRRSMGGHGFSHFSMIGHIGQCSDVNQTWEGDNNVLL